VGTSGYRYPHWRGPLYPPGLPAAAWLGVYAARFDTVELNSPFYGLPRPATVAGWRAAVPGRFVFAVKASRYLTHVRRLREPAEPLRRLLRRVRPLGPTLGPVLFQLPGTLRFDPGRLDGLLGALRRQRLVRPLRAVLEVRDPSWLAPLATARLAAAGVALCLADWAACPVDGPLTASFVYLRRHGSGARYAGSYPEAALARDAERIRAWLAEGRDVYAYFNNDGEGAAVQDAARLRALVRAPAVARPLACSA
jgi:uncharacterized protein YecE (DUF72 family)